MKKLLQILLFCGMLPGAFAQPSSNCGSISPEIQPTLDAIELCEGMPTEELTISLSSNLPNTEFFVVDVSQSAVDGLGDVIVGISDDGIFIPENLGFTYDEYFAVRPFSCNVSEFSALVDAILNNTSGGTPCCEVPTTSTIKDFCENLGDVGIYSGENVNTLSDVWKVMIAYAGNAGNNFSVEGFKLQINTLKIWVDSLPEDCRYSSNYCYAEGSNEQLFRVLEAPEIVDVITSTPDEITIYSTISDGELEYSIDLSGDWQFDNTIRNVPSEGMVYVRKVGSECYEEKTYENFNLNVTLREFKGTAEATTNLLYWVTETEINSAGFNIERSEDGQDFEKIAWVDGAGDSQISVDYTFRDMSPLAGTSYYRLGMEDTGGRVEYSPTTSVQRKDGTGFSILSIGPNPSANIINVSILNEEIGPVEYLVYDVMGRKVRHGTQELAIGINNFSIDATVMGTGMYVFTALKGDYVVSAYKFVMH